MENITLTFSENLSISEMMEQFIPDDATCISVKINIPDYDPSDNEFIPPNFADVVKYLKDSGVEILACSSGIHLNGRHEIPHIHYHFIANHYTAPTNASLHRKRWVGKKENKDICSLEDVSIRYQSLKKNEPRFQFLAYPLKEGIKVLRRCYIYDGKKMSNEMLDFLLSVGQTIYQTACALRLRQNKCQERKQLALKELFDLCKTKTFSNFREMMLWLDKNYIDTLDLDDLPDPKNYKTNCQKVAVKLGILKYSDI